MHFNCSNRSSTSDSSITQNDSHDEHSRHIDTHPSWSKLFAFKFAITCTSSRLLFLYQFHGALNYNLMISLIVMHKHVSACYSKMIFAMRCSCELFYFLFLSLGLESRAYTISFKYTPESKLH